MIRGIGVDFGQSADQSAAAVLERWEGHYAAEHDGKWGIWDGDGNAWIKLKEQWYRKAADATAAIKEAKLRVQDDRLICTSIKTWTQHTDYCDVANNVLELPSDVIVPDMCGVGRPIVDLLRQRAMAVGYKGKICPVTTVGSNVTRSTMKREPRGAVHVVPKIEMVTALVILQQQKRILLPNTQEADNLIDQLGDYRMRYSEKGNQQFGNKPGKHDDLVSALGLITWWMTRFGVRKPCIYMP